MRIPLGFLALLLLPPACSKEQQPTPAPAASSSASVSVVSTAPAASPSPSPSASSSTSAVPSTSASGNVQAKDCTAWGEHFARVMKKEGARGVDACPKGSISTKEMDDMAKAALDKEADRLAAELAKSCVGQIGKPFVARDAACFLKAQTPGAWTACKFESTLFVELEQKARTTTTAWSKKCGEGRKPGDEY